MKFDEFELDTEYYSLEHLTDSPKNLELINDFTVSNNAYGLEEYLKNYAVEDEKNDDNKTYVIKDKRKNELIGYFSLRTGLMTIQSEFVEDAFNTLPSIELSNFAVNAAYKDKHPEFTSPGYFIFTFFILPLVTELKKYVGINTLYIYALPNDRLIDYYKKLGFERLPEDKEKFVYAHVKPKYDEDCIFMYQTI